MKTRVPLWSNLAKFFIEWEMFQINYDRKTKRALMFNKFFFENRTVYEIMWKTVVEPDRPQMRI